MNAPRRDSTPAAEQAFFLPDFCARGMTFAIILIAESVALLIALDRQAVRENFWVDLTLASLFLLWISLGCAFALCRVRTWLSHMPLARSVAIALAIMVGIVALVSEVTFQLGQYLTGGVPALLAMFPERHFDFVGRNAAIGLIVASLALRYFYVNAEWKRSVELEARARIHALQARIRPHFLFNSMNTIAALTRSDPRLAEEAVQDLADLFRANLSDARQRISLSEEIEVARVYQRIESLRLGDRLRVTWRVDELPKDALAPSLLLQPLLENAIYHGVERLPDGGEVAIEGRFADDLIEIQVTNPVPAQGLVREREGNKFALDNIAQRLQLAWPDRARVDVREGNGLFVVILRFPYTAHTQRNDRLEY